MTLAPTLLFHETIRKNKGRGQSVSPFVLPLMLKPRGT
jgi:hypothetical protein